MSWFLLVIFLGLSSGSLLEAGNDKKLPSAVVVGTVYCDTCFQQEFSRGSHFISGASVAVECKDGNNSKPRFWKEVKTDEHGEFKVELPFSVGKHVRKIKACTVKLLSSSEPYCAVASAAASSPLHIKSRKQGQHIFSAGFFSFKPLKEPNLCNQKPSIQENTHTSKGKGVQACQQCESLVVPGRSIRNHAGLSGFTFENKNSKKIDASRITSPPYSDPSFPPSLQDPATLPGGFPGLPSLPPLPGLPTLPTLPLLPPLPGLPGTPRPPLKAKEDPNPTKHSKEDQFLDQKVAQIGNILHPLQPPNLPPLTPSPFQPPLFPFPPLPGSSPSPQPPSLPTFPSPFPPFIPPPVSPGLPPPVSPGLPLPVSPGLPPPVSPGLPLPVSPGLPLPVSPGVPPASSLKNTSP